MKRKIAIIMLAVMCFSGCSAESGSVEEKPLESPNASTEVEVPVVPEVTEAPQPVQPEATEEPTTTEAPEATPDVAVPMEYLDVTFDYTYDSFFNDTSMMYGHYGSIRLNMDGYMALADAVDTYNEMHATNRQSYLDSIEQWAVDEYREYGAEMFMGPYAWEGDMSIRRADSMVLSVLEECFDYAGGAHGYNYFNSVNFDAQTGERITLEAVVKDVSSLPEILDIELTEKYPDIIFFSDPLSEMLQDYFGSHDSSPYLVWTLDYEGVTFYFGSYDIASYADGLQQVTISYTEYPHILEEKFFQTMPSDYVLKLTDAGMDSDIDLDRDGVTDYISVRRIFDIDMYMSNAYDVTVNGNTFRQEKYCYTAEPYLVKDGDKNYLYVQSTADSDFKSVDVYEITPNSVKYIASFNGSLDGFTNSADFAVNRRFDMLSTYDAAGKCYVGEDGMPVAKSGVYTINREIIITSTVDISAELVDEGGNLLGTTYTFATGTNFELKTTDGETYIDVLAGDGQRCRFYTMPKWPPTVNGLDADSSFEMLYYAG